jgi:hypothetical protein
MLKYTKLLAVLIGPCCMSLACSSGAYNKGQTSQSQSYHSSNSQGQPIQNNPNGAQMNDPDFKKIYGLPFAGEQGFSDLDSYIAFRKTLKGMDIPHYRQIGPNLFQLEGGRMREPETFTRRDLELKFGFRKKEL